MINQEQLINGIIRYIDAEVMSALPTSGKWVAGTAIAIASAKSTSILNALMNHPLMKSLELVNEDGMIDAEMLFNAARTAAERYGVMEVKLPLIGNLTFSATDIDALKRHVMGGYMG